MTILQSVIDKTWHNGFHRLRGLTLALTMVRAVAIVGEMALKTMVCHLEFGEEWGAEDTIAPVAWAWGGIGN